MSDFEAAQGISVNGADLTLFTARVIIEIVEASTSDPKEAREKLENLCRRLNSRRNGRDPRIAVLFGALAEKLARADG